MPDGTHSKSISVRSGDHGQQSSFGGHYFRRFELPKADFGPNPEAALAALAEGMILTEALDAPSSAQDSELPSGYTYFGQFVAHDLTFQVRTTHERELDKEYLLDYRTPRFDLDCLYGRGPADQPYFFTEGKRFLEGRPFAQDGVNDLPRVVRPAGVALIGDPRNDDNVITSQLHGLFLSLHNRIVDQNPGWSFSEAQQALRLHYQYVVLEDLLPRLVGTQLVEELISRRDGRYRLRGISHFRRHPDPAIPLEFSVAAFRLGHSMVRPSYRLNRALPAFPTVHEDRLKTLVAFAKPMLPSWGIEWDLFVDLPGTPPRELTRDRLQMAYKIDACLANPLSKLPPFVGNLAKANLMKGLMLGLPSGQAVARELGYDALPDDEILIGNVSEGNGKPIAELDSGFRESCPLWVYVLAEAHAARERDRKAREARAAPGVVEGHPRQLGEVGGRIVAETFLSLLAADESSLLNRREPFEPFLGPPPFDLAALIAAALRPRA